MLNFSALDWKYLFGGNLVQKIKTVLAEILFLVECENAEFNGDLHFLNFKREIPFLGRLV